LSVGGDVIVAIDDQEVRQFEDLLVYILRSTEVGQQVTLSIIREGQQRTITVRLGERPSD
jgi:serine protease Do